MWSKTRHSYDLRRRSPAGLTTRQTRTDGMAKGDDDAVLATNDFSVGMPFDNRRQLSTTISCRMSFLLLK
jgi:hypothetical protein